MAELTNLTQDQATNTRRVYRMQWTLFTAFCVVHGYKSLPAQPASVADYITHLVDVGRKLATIRQALAAISFAHESAKYINPTKSPKVKETLKGIRRTIG